MLKKFLLWSLAISLIAFSCEDDRDLVTLKVGDAPAFLAPASGLVVDITQENLNDVLADFSWSPADYGFSAGVSYVIEIDVAGNAFANAEVIGTTTKLNFEVSNSVINGIMVDDMDLPEDVFTDMEFRITADGGSQLPALVSDIIAISISPVAVNAVVYPKLYVPGSYQGWDEANEQTVIYSVQSNNIYDGYLYIQEDAATYRYSEGPNGEGDWGDSDADGVLEEAGDNISLGDAGLYRFNVNLDELTHSATRTEWGVIGNATAGGWDTDTDMTYDTETGLWTVEIDLVADNFIKFRANDTWDVNLGDNNTDATMEYDGADIPITTSGTYTVELDLTDAVYTYKLRRN